MTPFMTAFVRCTFIPDPDAMRLRRPLLALAAVAIVSAWPAAIAVAEPAPDEQWAMTADNAASGRTVIGDAAYGSGVYEIILKSVRERAGAGGSDGAVRPFPRPVVVTSAPGSPALFSSDTGISIDPARLPSTPDPKTEIRFEAPSQTLRRPLGAEVDTALWLADPDPKVSYRFEESLSAEGHNRFIESPDLKLGRYENGELVEEIDNVMAMPLIAGGDDAERRALLTFISILTSPETARSLPGIFRPGKGRVVGQYSFPAKFTKQEFKKVRSGPLVYDQMVETPVTREVIREIMETHIAGAAVVLHSPQAEGLHILWSWRIESVPGTGDTVTVATGSPAAGNPIIWGPKPYIEQVFVLNAQDGRKADGTVLFPWPGEDGAVITASKDRRAFLRDIVIVGRNLEVWEGRTPLGNLANVGYDQVRSILPDKVAERLGEYDAAAVSSESQQAAELALRRVPSRSALHVSAEIDGPVEAQPVLLKIDDQSGQWPLLFGDHSGRVDIVRIGVPAPDTFDTTVRLGDKAAREEASKRPRQTTEERANPVFFRDEIVFEATFEEDVEEETLDVSLVGAAGEAGVGPERDKAVTLSRIPDDPRRFRSKPYLVIEPSTPAGDASESAAPGDYGDVPAGRALAWPKDTLLRPRLATRMTGRPFPDAPVLRADAVDGDFIRALKRAASCMKSPPRVDWDDLSVAEEFDVARMKSESLSTSVIGLGQAIETTLGQHAAMIMMRDAYLDLVSPVLNELNTYADLKVSAARIWSLTQDLWIGERSVLSGLEDRSGQSLGAIVAEQRRRQSWVDRMEGTAKLGSVPILDEIDVLFVRDWLQRARGDIRESVKVARSAGDCDVAKLVLLTSIGFDPIVNLLQARVTRLETDRRDKIKRRRPDVVARRELNSVSALHRRYAAEVELVSRRWLWIKTSASAIAAFASYYALAHEVAAAAMTAGALETFDAVTTCVDNYCGAGEDATKLGFAEGAAYLFGDDYLKAVEDTTTSNFYRGIETFVQVAGGAMAVGDIFKAYNSHKLLTNADELLKAYGDAARPATTKNFRGIARKFWREAKGKPAMLAGELDPKTTAALTEFLGTPEKHLSVSLRKAQAEMRQALEASLKPGQIGALIQKADVFSLQKAATAVPDAFDLYGVGATTIDAWATQGQPPAGLSMPKIELPAPGGINVAPMAPALPSDLENLPSFEVEIPRVEIVPPPGSDTPEITLPGGTPFVPRSER